MHIKESFMLKELKRKRETRILVANNSLAAHKFIISLRKLKRKFKLFGLATKEDLTSCYIEGLDSFELLESGPPIKNFENIDAIVDAAKKFNVDFVWPGWGYLSEKCELPRRLKLENIGFLGPSEESMSILGDKCRSKKLCEQLNIPTIPSIIIVNDKLGQSFINQDTEKFNDSKKNNLQYVKNVKNSELLKDLVKVKNKNTKIDFKKDFFDFNASESNHDKKNEKNQTDSKIFLQKEDALDRKFDMKENVLEKNIGNNVYEFIKKNDFPLLLKASNSGGGKGIISVNSIEEILKQMEILNSCCNDKFMLCKKIENARHVEIQIAADKKGNVICFGARDCSTQRRHQKLIEECHFEETCLFFAQMCLYSERLAKNVGYFGLATVEFLVTKDNFYFLEVNTRIQVEHPITELKYNINIPELQVLIAEGFDIRNYKIKKSKKHVMGVRLVAEDVSKNFLPITGHLSIRVPFLKNVYYYFSKINGEINKFSDSQFGHIFVKEKSRDKCIKKMIKYLKALKIDGLCTNIEFMIHFMKLPIFLQNKHCIKTLGDLLHKNVQNLGSKTDNCENLKFYKTKKNPVIEPIILFVFIYAYNSNLNEQKVRFLFEKKINNIEYFKSVHNSILFCKKGAFVLVKYLKEGDNFYLFQDDAMTKFTFAKNENCYKIFNEGQIFRFNLNFDNYELESQTDGKIIRFLKKNYEYISKDEDYVEIEIMKMRICFKSNYSGIFHQKKYKNNYIENGEVLAVVKIDDNLSYEENEQKLNLSRPFDEFFEKTMIMQTIEMFKGIFNGYTVPYELLNIFKNIIYCDLNVFLDFLVLFHNNHIETRQASILIEITLEKILLNAKLFQSTKIFMNYKEIIELIDNLVIRGIKNEKIYNLIIKLKNVFSEYKFKATNLTRLNNISEQFYSDFLMKNCCYKESILFALDHMKENRMILVKKYLENILGQKYKDLQLALEKQVCYFSFNFQGLEKRGIFYVCGEDCESFSEKNKNDFVLHYNCRNNLGSNHLYIVKNNKAPFIEYIHKNKKFLCDSIIFTLITSEKFQGQNLIYKDIFRNMCIYLNDKNLDVIYTIDTHSGNSVLDVKNISHAIKQILSSIKLIYKKYNVNESFLKIEVEGVIKITNKIIHRIADDCIFHYAKDYIKNGVLQCQIFFTNNKKNVIEFSILKGFLEKKVFENDKLLEYFIENVQIYKYEEKLRNDDIQKLILDNKQSKERDLARKLKTLTIIDALNLFKLCFLIKNTIFSIKEIYLKCSQKDLSYNIENYALTEEKQEEIGIKGFILEYDNKSFVLIVNDISFKNGSFSIKEYYLYTFLIRKAVKDSIPFVSISCNSGARLGLDENLKNKIQYKNEKISLHGQGFLEIDGKIVSIYGNKDSGPENLSLSGMIAKETIEAYKKTLTLSYVTGLSVGIGAYCNKLGQRIIQKNNSSILLTGYQALNTLLQTNIYSSNEEIGGVKIMQENGNCHVNVNNDYDGILEIIKWIDYFYSSRKYNKKIEKNEFLINYDAEYKKNNFIELYKDNKKYNENINEREILEFICDENSITEYKKEFGKKIFCGRGKIKSVSFGILCTQNEIIESSKNVLDVNSSKKIAQSISDFEKEGLDILILANFRGFSGGKEEMINNILNHGSLIIKKLYECKTRVLIYIVPGGEMRGGSWVVFDKNINPLIKIIAHPRSEVGIIEPAGICKLKFKEKERREIFKVENLEYNDEKAIKLANDFCKLHDSCYRMYLNGMIDDLICLDELRKYVYDNLLT